MTAPKINKTERRKEFQSFIQRIDLDKLTLLPDTVTELRLVFSTKDALRNSKLLPMNEVKEPEDPCNRYMDIVHRLQVQIQEDPLRIVYPTYDPSAKLPAIEQESITVEDDINGTASRIKIAGIQGSWIYKTVDKPFYRPNDTEVFLQELHNLQSLHGKSCIGRIYGVVTSVNPYSSNLNIPGPLVIRGFLMVYYTGGSLEAQLQRTDSNKALWKRWLVQIGYGLQQLHKNGITHMDLKPANVVIDDDGNAFLIDISGIGGMTWEWAAPETRVKPFAELSPTEKVLNDIWAYGQILSAIAQSFAGEEGTDDLKRVAQMATHEDPHMRISLDDALSELRSSQSGILTV